MSYNGVDRKDRIPSPASDSHRNVVDHEAPHGTSPLSRIMSNFPHIGNPLVSQSY
ncbi:hypothetical protein BDP27DRAFT_1225512 [Rhodocollybia butyracea]|uniref:Uncharacterized protein n=1 Tax=Rhodocollybia butyracea TaxID=206335 RepID=A0A9P5U6C5_9AGAR|nr:hypothetical protein BDP27DRAFT_1225512 [Rhodocollybia butyracea]